MLVNLVAIEGRNGIDVLQRFGISTTDSQGGYIGGALKDNNPLSVPAACFEAQKMVLRKGENGSERALTLDSRTGVCRSCPG